MTLRQTILSTARTLFVQRGFAGLSMRELAEAVGVTKAALYYHFRDKEALYLDATLEFLAEMEGMVLETPPGTAQAQVQYLVQSILALPLEQRAFIRLVSQETSQLGEGARQQIWQAYQQRFLSHIQTLLEAGIQGGELQQVPAHMLLWALLGLLYPYFYPTQGHDLVQPETAAQLASIFLHGASA